ncbi:hypothetical protein HAX54_029662 [Datura stramonium]|uniref:Uncharacterized protein n=1 Tax=Datura stramonium TaxID=4076 RepID=A0ABS8SAF3_DATST|nr:hypothetical protein [Datura stramonium]
MYIEERSRGLEAGEEVVVSGVIENAEKSSTAGKVLCSSGSSAKNAIVVLDVRRVMVGVGARALFYPTLLYNVVRNKIQVEFRWWDWIDEAHGIRHLVLPTEIMLPIMNNICQAVEFIHAFCHDITVTSGTMSPVSVIFDSLKKMLPMDKVHTCTARLVEDALRPSSYAAQCVKYKQMTPNDAYNYVKSNSSKVGTALPSDRVRVAGGAALARLSCMWLRCHTDQKIPNQKLTAESKQLESFTVDIHVFS